MARTITEIKKDIENNFMLSREVAEKYGFNPGDSFSAHFSTVSVENILFYVFASSAWVLETLFDRHRQEIDARIEQIIPHRPKWYRDKMLAFMKDRVLIPDTDRYDVSDMSQEQANAARVVKHATADESKNASILIIKVAGEKNGERCDLDEETEIQLESYIAAIKDAGVRTRLVNDPPDVFNCTVDIYYNPLLLPEEVKRACETAIKQYIENLPFNGEYTNMALVDTLQVIEGVKVVELRQATTSPHNSSVSTVINAKHIPEAGYFKNGSITINMTPYE